MAKLSLKDSEKYYIELSENPKRFDADSPVTNVFFDDTNGQVFSVRSGGVTGVTVIGVDDNKSTSFRMEDKGSIVSIKFSPDHMILAIQRNHDNQSASVEFQNFSDLNPTNIEYAHTCKWKNAKILGFVWSKINEIAFITDHGIELLQVVPEKKQLKSLKSTSFSGAWFSWCSLSKIVILAGNNGALLQPFSLSGSTITKLTRLELESGRPVAERDVFALRVCGAAWCAVFRHAAAGPPASALAAPTGPTEVCLMPVSSAGSHHMTHVLRTGLVGRFAVNVVDDLIVVHHQSSQTSLIFDIMEETSSKLDDNTMLHIPVLPGVSMKPAIVEDQMCPMYSANWVAFQPDYMIDARLGCLWRVLLRPPGLAHSIAKEEIPKIVALLLRRTDGKDAIYRILNQLVEDAGTYLVELSRVFDEINDIYRKWADAEVARSTAGGSGGTAGMGALARPFRVVVSQADMCAHVLSNHADHQCIVQVVTAYLASLWRRELVVQQPAAELAVRALVTRQAAARLRALLRRGCLSDSRPLACQLLSLGHIDPAAAQLALDMMWRLKAYEEIVEVLLSWEEPVSAAGAAKQAGVWGSLSARKLLAAARAEASRENGPGAFVAVYNALRARNERTRGSGAFLKGEQCEAYVEYYKEVTAEN